MILSCNYWIKDLEGFVKCGFFYVYRVVVWFLNVCIMCCIVLLKNMLVVFWSSLFWNLKLILNDIL